MEHLQVHLSRYVLLSSLLFRLCEKSAILTHSHFRSFRIPHNHFPHFLFVSFPLTSPLCSMIYRERNERFVPRSYSAYRSLNLSRSCTLSFLPPSFLLADSLNMSYSSSYIDDLLGLPRRLLQELDQSSSQDRSRRINENGTYSMKA